MTKIPTYLEPRPSIAALQDSSRMQVRVIQVLVCADASSCYMTLESLKPGMGASFRQLHSRSEGPAARGAVRGRRVVLHAAAEQRRVAWPG